MLDLLHLVLIPLLFIGWNLRKKLPHYHCWQQTRWMPAPKSFRKWPVSVLSINFHKAYRLDAFHLEVQRFFPSFRSQLAWTEFFISLLLELDSLEVPQITYKGIKLSSQSWVSPKRRAWNQQSKLQTVFPGMDRFIKSSVPLLVTGLSKT